MVANDNLFVAVLGKNGAAHIINIKDKNLLIDVKYQPV